MEHMELQPGDMLRFRQWTPEDYGLLDTYAHHERLYAGDLILRQVLEQQADGLYLTQGVWPDGDCCSPDVRTVSQRYIDRHAKKLMQGGN